MYQLGIFLQATFSHTGFRGVFFSLNLQIYTSLFSFFILLFVFYRSLTVNYKKLLNMQ